jgi:hypothetical protein
MLCTCYLRKGIVYVPTLGRVGRAHYRVVEPITVTPVSQTSDLRDAFREAIARGNPTVPPLPIRDRPPPLMLKYARVSSWAAFERSTLTWDLTRKDGAYEIIGHRRRADRGWEPDPTNTIILGRDSTAEDLIDRIVAILQDSTAVNELGAIRE